MRDRVSPQKNKKSENKSESPEGSPNQTVRYSPDGHSVWDAPLHAVDPTAYVKPSKQRRGTIFGVTLALFVIALYTFSMYNLGQENFDDVRLPDETLKKLKEERGKAEKI